ncbi:DUF2911 domain-containing protein [Marinoscillum furvescens]|uniref:DUF2911 family protein n=1 Tax=Marinoscillum furvescens DSM 4134 TaxID=1122208 RepID=A0A3D9L3S7_MARFU|nr:DUF2911 domain-containing protein [Marinoscillum furvescens]RED97018.1 hypothetical protein C7460_11366 [Marinoscillum furvescens DSM 4134]
MNKIAKLTLLCILCAFGTAYAQIDMPQPSPAGSVTSKVGLTDVTVDYFRPKMKGRAIFGEGSDFLVPFGQVWRTGANSGSKLTLSTDATIAGTKVEAGTYLIFTKPGKDSWDFMLYSDLSLGGNVNGYDKSKEVLSTSVKPEKVSPAVETLTFNISDISEDNTSANIQLTWSDVSVKVPIEVSFVDEVMAQIEKATQVNPTVYVQAANFYLSQNKDLEQALEWMNLYLAQGNNSKQFWHVHTKAKILAALDQKKEAIATAKNSLELAENNPQGDFGYVKRNKDLIKSLK